MTEETEASNFNEDRAEQVRELEDPIKSDGPSPRGSHRLADVRICPRKWQLRYWERIVPIDEPMYRQSGSLGHLVVADYYAKKMEKPPAWFLREPLEAALARVGLGRPASIRNALALIAAYKERWEHCDPWRPKYIEETFAATLKQLDPNGDDEPGIHVLGVDGRRDYVAPRLDDEVVTCKPDMVVEVTDPTDGQPYLWIVDHKTQRPQVFGRPKGAPPPRLHVMRDDGEYTIHFQALVNLHVVRANLGSRVRGFIIQRINRDPPYDTDRRVLKIPPRAYQEVPALLRGAVRDERDLGTRLAKGIRATPHLWACQTRYGACDYRTLCAAETREDVEAHLRLTYAKLP